MSCISIELAVQLPDAGDEVKDESEAEINQEEVENYHIPFSYAFSEHRAMMVVFLAAFVAKGTMLRTDVSINLTGNAINSLLRKGLLLVFEGSSGVEKEKCREKKGN